jgi:hypothetical protein
MKKNKCMKYELAITNYILGEELPIPQAELFEHLRQCVNCRQDLVNWQDLNAAWRAEASMNKPEVKARYESLIKALAPCQPPKPIPGGKVLDNKIDIGKAAGAIWNCLSQNGMVEIKDLAKKVKVPDDIANWAVGWLSREDKVCITKTPQTSYVYLIGKEREQKQAGV